MKKLLIFSGLLLASFYIVAKIDLFDQLLAFLFIGLIPYTDISIPPLAMFFAWLSLPLIIFSAYATIKGLFLLSLILAEHIDRSIVAYRLSRIESDRPIVEFKYVKQTIKKFANRSVQINQLFKRRIGKLSSDAN